jgi:hypothetical protein
MNLQKRQIRARRRIKTMNLARVGVPFNRSAFTFDKPDRKPSARKLAAIKAREDRIADEAGAALIAMGEPFYGVEA